MFNCFLLFVSVVTLLMDDAYALTNEEQAVVNAVRQIVQSCAQDNGLTIEAVEAAKHDGTFAYLDPCFFACFFKKTGFINENGVFDPYKTYERNRQFIKDENYLKDIAEIVQTCTSVNYVQVRDGLRGCDRSELLIKCFTAQKNYIPLLTA